MKIFITGACGFIGSHITSSLINDGHNIICAVRDIMKAKLMFPSSTIYYCNFNTDSDKSIWINRLKGVDLVINVVGILQTNKKDNAKIIHELSTISLFDACIEQKIKKIIHISALGIDKTNTEYSKTKLAADKYLQKLNIDWIILRPSLIYASNSFGGTSLLRVLFVLPIIPLIGNGFQKFQPIHITDLVKTISFFINKKNSTKQVLDIIGPETLILRDILIKLRSWLNLKPTKTISIPKIIIKFFCKLGDLFNASTINSTAFKMLSTDNISKSNKFFRYTKIKPKKFDFALEIYPSSIQSVWHAKLYLFKSIAKYILAFFWLYSGILPFFQHEQTIIIIKQILRSNYLSSIVFYSSCFVDIIIGITLLFRYKTHIIYIGQIIIISIYTCILTIFLPKLWLEPLGPIIKNIPIILLLSILLSVERDK
ncbi:SDR family oxidoreductase [Rickettsiales endosymbiont of Trichoplax sp. H2]|uniref:SDR family oxidoreductase n=1 Tax=Rickettsiales endosymbiont of Trichoplax sp. H2 TaxID=2021221 RepID=UPI0012B23C5A|nr:SDR family oxidoreductase [Rickettsiales endosymbiont of Trichoplax sp. H2]MSO13277.1 protein YbjT [Rickettsiales endosymbiont of Trichoplax sp. H2]